MACLPIRRYPIQFRPFLPVDWHQLLITGPAEHDTSQCSSMFLVGETIGDGLGANPLFGGWAGGKPTFRDVWFQHNRGHEHPQREYLPQYSGSALWLEIEGMASCPIEESKMIL